MIKIEKIDIFIHKLLRVEISSMRGKHIVCEFYRISFDTDTNLITDNDPSTIKDIYIAEAMKYDKRGHKKRNKYNNDYGSYGYHNTRSYNVGIDIDDYDQIDQDYINTISSLYGVRNK